MASIILVGALGRMGKAVLEAAAEMPGVRVKARIDRVEGRAVLLGPGDAGAGYEPGNPSPAGSAGLGPMLEAVAHSGDVVIEFSSPAGAADLASACARAGLGLVSGSTGLGPEEEVAVRAAAERVAIVRAANFSLGVLALRRALTAALAALPADWDIEIVERHHRRKADSPSGTALLLAREAAARRGLSEKDFQHGRVGRVGARPPEQIGIHAVRGGSWVGDHSVLLAGVGESLELRHVAQDRGAFARGAIFAAQFVTSAAPGLYTLEDVVPHNLSV